MQFPRSSRELRPPPTGTPTSAAAAPTAVEVEPAVEAESATRLAPRWRVIIHNDPITTMDFVVDVLQGIFRLSKAHARDVMWEAHTSGAALVGVYPLEQAEFLVDRAHSRARTAKFPLRFSLEPED